jgi:octaprenyl-diphosphate synthase
MVMKEDIKSLKEITAPIFEDIRLFEQEFKEALHSEVRLINTVGKYILRHRGKHIRPILTILSARLCGKPSMNSYRAAAMIELLHIATLVHDDVVDEAEKRRGFPSINRVWKNKVAVLMGDYILSKALLRMVGLKDFKVLELISNTAEKLSAGEILQIEKNLTRSMNEQVYFDMIYQKTASLISTSCELGALTSSGSDQDREAMRTYGSQLGLAFQVKDDLFDLLGNEKDTGKDIGVDVKRNLITLPLIHCFKTFTRSEVRQIKRILSMKRKSSEDLEELRGLIAAGGGFDYAYQKIDEFNNRAVEALTPYPDSPYKQSMLDLISYNAKRIN